MFKVSRIINRMVFAVAFLLVLNASAFAQASSPETITLAVDLTLPTGTQVTGTVLIERKAGTTTDNISFVGTVSGAYTSIKATGTETWSDPNDATLTVDKITEWNSTKRQPPLPVILQFSQTSANLFTINGVPVAISGWLKPPGGGSASYIVRVAGSGPQDVTTLPNTGAGPISGVSFTPGWITTGLVGSGLVLLLLGLYLSRRHRIRY
jgi:hypothetical protein